MSCRDPYRFACGAASRPIASLERLVIHAPDRIAASADILIGELAARADAPPVLVAPAISRAIVTKG